jgi:hypothetical protein
MSKISGLPPSITYYDFNYPADDIIHHAWPKRLPYPERFEVLKDKLKGKNINKVYRNGLTLLIAAKYYWRDRELEDFLVSYGAKE